MDVRAKQRLVVLTFAIVVSLLGYWGLETDNIFAVFALPGLLPGLVLDVLFEGTHGGRNIWMVVAICNFAIYYAGFYLLIFLLSRRRRKARS